MSDTTLKSHLVRPKDTGNPARQESVVYRIPCECGKIYIGETGRRMRERMKIRLTRIRTSAVSEHANKTGHLQLWNEVKFFDRDSQWYTRRVNEAIHVRLQPDNINKDNGIEQRGYQRSRNTVGDRYDSKPRREQLWSQKSFLL